MKNLTREMKALMSLWMIKIIKCQAGEFEFEAVYFVFFPWGNNATILTRLEILRAKSVIMISTK